MHYTGASDSDKPLFKSSATTEEIIQHREQVRRSQNPCPVRICPKCHEKSDSFIRYDKKNRKFRVVIEQVIHVVLGLLTCWKCPECGKCFMGYPPFAIPYKRYTIPTICAFSQRYVENDAMTYRNLIEETPLLSSTCPEWELSSFHHPSMDLHVGPFEYDHEQSPGLYPAGRAGIHDLPGSGRFDGPCPQVSQRITQNFAFGLSKADGN